MFYDYNSIDSIISNPKVLYFVWVLSTDKKKNGLRRDQSTTWMVFGTTLDLGTTAIYWVYSLEDQANIYSLFG